MEFAKQLFAELMPWMDFAGVEWSTLRIDRTEPFTGTGDRPPGAFCHTEGNVTTAWPTKLALAPDLADRVLSSLEEAGIRPGGEAVPPLDLSLPAVARAPWED